MLIGYMRVSKADGSQVLDLQRDALISAGVKRSRLYQDQASAKRDDRPGLEACLKALREGDTLIVRTFDRLTGVAVCACARLGRANSRQGQRMSVRQRTAALVQNSPMM